MRTESLGLVVTAAAIVVVVGCSEEPRLTEHQVNQILAVQQSVVAEQAALDRGRDELEADRRLWSERDRRDPIIAESIESATLLMACCLPILIVLMLFWRRPQQPDFDVAEAVLLELSGKELSGSLLEAKEGAVPMLEDRRKA